MQKALEYFSPRKIKKLVKQFAEDCKIPQETGILIVLSCCMHIPALATDCRTDKKILNMSEKEAHIEAIRRWVKKFALLA